MLVLLSTSSAAYFKTAVKGACSGTLNLHTTQTHLNLHLKAMQ